MTNAIAEIVDRIANPVIFALAVVLLFLIIRLAGQLSTLRTEASEKLLRTNGSAQINPKTLAMKQRNSAIASRETSYELKDRFNRSCAEYSTISHLIPVLPLIGILGTVAGLYRQVSTMDAAIIYDALDTALSTTLWGLFTAVVLKCLEAVMIVRRLEETESIFDSYDIRYNDATLQKDFAEETDG